MGVAVDGMIVVGSIVGMGVDGVAEGKALGDKVKANGTLTRRSGQVLTGPMDGFKYKQLHAAVPVVVSTLTESPDLAHTTKSSSSPSAVNTQ